jgi:tRNA A-37 threonylcarbamoyl transferase component Bud32
VGRLRVSMLKAIEKFHEFENDHRDIHRNNFVFGGHIRDFSICLVDFGFAKSWRER